MAIERQALKISWLNISVNVVMDSGGANPERIQIDYVPVALQPDAPGVETELDEYRGRLELSVAGLPTYLGNRIGRLTEVVRAVGLDLPTIEIDGVSVQVTAPHLVYYSFLMGRPLLPSVGGGPTIRLVYRPHDGAQIRNRDIKYPLLTEASGRLIETCVTTCEQLAWNHLRDRLGRPVPPAKPQKKVIVSYRKTKPEYGDFAKAVAHKLGHEGFLPWFDDWDIVAGDSLPREIGEAFKDVYAVVLILTPDYPEGKWAREELETAITKRVEQNIKVIPVVYETGEIPELLRPLARVNCTDHREEVFEAQFRRVIDALNEIDINPYRR